MSSGIVAFLCLVSMTDRSCTCTQILHTCTYLKLDITPLASPAWPLDLEHCLPISIHDGEPGVDKGAVLLDVPDHGPRGTLHFNLLQTAEAAPSLAPQGTLDVDHLRRREKHERLDRKLSRECYCGVCVCVCVCVCGGGTYRPTCTFVQQNDNDKDHYTHMHMCDCVTLK